MKTYDLVKELLEKYPALRDSDRLLIWNVWGKLGFLNSDYGATVIEKSMFMKAPHPETIRRSRADIQRRFPELRSSKAIQKMKNEKAAEKGTHIYREGAGDDSDN